MSYTELHCKAVIVRKEHSCCWCGEKIAIGETAQHRAYVFDGDFQSDYMHLECFGAYENYPHMDELMEGWTFGAFARGSSEEPV